MSTSPRFGNEASIIIWRRSSISLSRGMITATCPSSNGTQITTTINAARCNGGDIANVNGRLQCR